MRRRTRWFDESIDWSGNWPTNKISPNLGNHQLIYFWENPLLIYSSSGRLSNQSFIETKKTERVECNRKVRLVCQLNLLNLLKCRCMDSIPIFIFKICIGKLAIPPQHPSLPAGLFARPTLTIMNHFVMSARILHFHLFLHSPCLGKRRLGLFKVCNNGASGCCYCRANSCATNFVIARVVIDGEEEWEK